MSDIDREKVAELAAALTAAVGEARDKSERAVLEAELEWLHTRSTRNASKLSGALMAWAMTHPNETGEEPADG